MIAWSALLGAWLAGTLGGAHCLAMCGGFVTALSGGERPGALPLRSAGDLAWAQVPYNLGRISTYAVLGATAGGAGATLLETAQWLPVQRALYVVANLALLGLAWLVLSRGEAFAWLQRAGGRVFRVVQPAIGRLVGRQEGWARYALGGLWGLVPCGMIYAILPVALFSGGWWQGAAVMLAFGAGTLPALMAAGWVAARARRWLERPGVRRAAAALLAGFAMVGFWRAFGDPALLAQGPFCLVP